MQTAIQQAPSAREKAERDSGPGGQAHCPDGDRNCSSLIPGPDHQFLQQALGSPGGDMRLPAVLLTAAALLAVVGAMIRRRLARRAPELQMADPQMSDHQVPDHEIPGERRR